MLNTEFKFKISKTYIIVLSAMIIISFIALIFLPLMLMIIGSLIVASIAFHLIYRHGLMQSNKSLLAIKYQDDIWHLTTRGGIHQATLCGDSVVTPYVSILNYATDEKKKFSCVLFRDSFYRDEYRKLRVLLNTL